MYTTTFMYLSVRLLEFTHLEPSVNIVSFRKLLAYSIHHTSWNHSSVALTQEAIRPVGKLAVGC